MDETIPRTDIDTFTRYEWQVSSAIRPEWTTEGPRRTEDKVPLFREAYFGRRALAEPVRHRKEGPPYVVCTFPAHTLLKGDEQEEISLAFSKEEAERAVRRYDRRTLKEKTQPALFDAHE